MTLEQAIALRAFAIDPFQVSVGIAPISHAHPPSLKNPTPVRMPQPSDGWKKGSSKESRDKAKADLLELLRRSQNQIGVPVVPRTAKAPVFPFYERWL